MQVLPYYPPEPHILDWLQSFMLPTDIVFDIGSGDGRSHNIEVKKIITLDVWEKSRPDYLIDLNYLDIPDIECDVILMIDFLEHLEKDRSIKLLQQAQRIAKRSVVVLTPLKWDNNHEAFDEQGGFYEGSEHVKHRSLWNLADFDESWIRVWLPSTQESFFGYRIG